MPALILVQAKFGGWLKCTNMYHQDILRGFGYSRIVTTLEYEDLLEKVSAFGLCLETPADWIPCQ